MKCRTTLAVKLRNGCAALTVSIVLLTGATPTCADGHDKHQGTELDAKLRRIGHTIVIYQENWSFDSLYGQFPGADGLANGFGQLPQLDRTASPPYSALIYQTPSPLTGFPLAFASW